MIKPLFRRVLRLFSPSHGPSAQRITFSTHGIKRNACNYGARKTISTLQKAGFEAYVVGGALRDLWLGHTPKDFDVVTNATPEQIRRLFKRSHIIGRRFRLVHVLFGHEKIEVSTFRGHHHTHGDAQVHHSGRILRDNVFGSISEDAMRRDFTINALYYNPSTEELLDFHQSFADLQHKILRVIGEPHKRYVEDPIRMLRAIRLSAKLGFSLDEASQQPIAQLIHLLQEVPRNRLQDEMLKLFLSGHGYASFVALHNSPCAKLPLFADCFQSEAQQHFIHTVLKNTDERYLASQAINPCFLFAALLWHPLQLAWQKQTIPHPIPALQLAINDTLAKSALPIDNRHMGMMKDIWLLQPRFEQRFGQRPWRLVTHPRYRAGLDFLTLRCLAGEVDDALRNWWLDFTEANSETRQHMIRALKETNPKP